MKNYYRIRNAQISLVCLLFLSHAFAQDQIPVPPNIIAGQNFNAEIPNHSLNKATIPASLSLPDEDQINKTIINPLMMMVNETVWNGNSWSNGVPDYTKRAVLNANYTTSDIIEAQDILIKDGAILTLNEGGMLKIKQVLPEVTKAKMILKEGSGLISKSANPASPNSTFVRNNGYVNEYSSMFVSSPVSGQTIGGIYTGPNTDYIQAYNQSLYNGSAYVQIPESHVMQPGIGYIESTNGIHAPDYSFNAQILGGYQHTYDGGENTGEVQVAVGTGANLLGNPYASYLDLDTFIQDPDNVSVINGTIAIWTRNTVVSSVVPGSSIFNFSSNDYAFYNLLGGITAGRAMTISNTGIPVPANGRNNQIIPDGKLYFGTAFFVRGLAGGIAKFKPSMMTSGSQQFRTNSTATILPPERSRILINLSQGSAPTNLLAHSNLTPYRQTLIGYAAGATTAGTDRAFDYRISDQSSALASIDVYSFAPGLTTKLGLQGRDNFVNTDFFQLGYKTLGGVFTFSTIHDGIFNMQGYYIFDALSNSYHTLPYTFATGGGIFNDRFKVVFKLPSLPYVANNPPICGTTLTSVWNTVFSSIIPGAAGYKFRVIKLSDNSLVGDFNGDPSVPNRFNLNIPGNPIGSQSPIAYNTTYSVSVATFQVNGSWVFGSPCTVTTPSPPTTNLILDASGSCNKTVSNFGATLFANSPAELGYTTNGWRFEVRIGNPTGLTVGNIIERSVSNFSLAHLRPSYQPLPGTVYYVRVQIRFGSPAIGFVWQVDNLGNPNYGSTCTVTTTAGATGRFTDSSLQTTDFEANAYPNPFATNFKLDIATSSDRTIAVKVYDMVGRLIEERQVFITEIDTQEVGDNYPTGVYTIVISQGESIKTLRVIKR